MVRPSGDRVGSVTALASVVTQTWALTPSSVGASGFGAVVWRGVILRLSGAKELGMDDLVHMVRGQLTPQRGGWRIR